MNSFTPEEYHPFRKDEHFKIAKLKTGETILFAMETDVKDISKSHYVTMIEPMVIETKKRFRQNMQVADEITVLRPWIPLSDNDKYTVSSDMMITMCDQSEPVQRDYTRYVESVVFDKAQVRHQKQIDETIVNLLQTTQKTPVKFVEEVDHHEA